MGKYDIKITQAPEVFASVLGCSQREGCKLLDGEVERRLQADIAELEAGEPSGKNGLTLELVEADRITFAGTCFPSECEQTGACALRGYFDSTTPEMAEAQDVELPIEAQPVVQ